MSLPPKPCRDCGQVFSPSRHYHVRCWPCWEQRDDALRDERRSAKPVERMLAVLDARTIRAAIALTHPDRHPRERAGKATEITQQLTAALVRVRQIERGGP